MADKSALIIDETAIEGILREICEVMMNEPLGQDHGILGGTSGKALFFWYLSKRYPGWVKREQFDSLTDVIHSYIKQPITAGFGVGLSGVGSFLELILQEQECAYDKDYNSHIDEFIYNAVKNHSNLDELEYVQGLSGISVYAARRARMGQAIDLYKEIIYAIKSNARYFSDGKCSWETPRGSMYKILSAESEEYNLGLAHGVPSILASLIPALQYRETRDSAADLLKSGCSWLIDAAQPIKDYGSHYSYIASVRRMTRLGWCYGDLSVAVTLARAGAALGDAELTKIAASYAKSAAAREFNSTQVTDSAICHGSCGLIIMFMKLYKILDDELFIKAAKFWLNYTLNQYRAEGIRGFNIDNQFERNPNAAARRSISGFLNGLSGVGLTLLACSDNSADWYDLIML